MSRTEYYEDLKRLAREVRAENGLTTPKVGRADMRRLYSKYGIDDVDLKPLGNIRGAYFNDADGVSILLNSTLPDDPFIFTMGHELKHHLKDQQTPASLCVDKSNEVVEIGAEIFAAELIFPEGDFAAWLTSRGVNAGRCTPEIIVQMKHETRTTLSYSALAKRAAFLKFTPNEFKTVRWIALAEKMYGVPIYKKIQAMRRRQIGFGRV
ncbi:MAG: ImmA/IrrE family metallo-endopeptidase [Elusimicrobia bacterium]|nr:ImmA/IrrE family metallo-endopeptidase [Elusimicrobiota bacterium]MBK7689228.1 ImmA/IrrE family metallo-endopeptidase [Elusimicrobiota bacterium]MBK8651451.1 ImmA/IrrE family metallo-endopeptidase [Elusimicrobiota bacterium]